MILFFINCATTTTHLSSAHVLDPGHVESTVAGALYTNTVVTNHSIKTAAAIYEGMLEDPPEVTTEMARDMFDTGLAWTLFFPGQSSEFIGRVGLTNALLEGVDLGFRSNGSQSKIDIKTQLFASKNQRWAVAFASGFGWNQTLISTKVSQYTRSTFSRKDLDLSLNIGYRRPNVFEIYGGPRLIQSWVAATISEEDSIFNRLPNELSNYHPKALFQDEQLTYTGATIGSRVGYYFLFLNAECTVMWVDFHPHVFGEPRDLSGWHISPSIAITFVPGGIASLKKSSRSTER